MFSFKGVALKKHTFCRLSSCARFLKSTACLHVGMIKKKIHNPIETNYRDYKFKEKM